LFIVALECRYSQVHCTALHCGGIPACASARRAVLQCTYESLEAEGLPEEEEPRDEDERRHKGKVLEVTVPLSVLYCAVLYCTALYSTVPMNPWRLGVSPRRRNPVTRMSAGTKAR